MGNPWLSNTSTQIMYYSSDGRAFMFASDRDRYDFEMRFGSQQQYYIPTSYITNSGGSSGSYVAGIDPYKSDFKRENKLNKKLLLL